MKKLLILLISSVLLLSLGTATVFAAGTKTNSSKVSFCHYNNGKVCQFVDADNDNVCDNCNYQTAKATVKTNGSANAKRNTGSTENSIVQTHCWNRGEYCRRYCEDGYYGNSYSNPHGYGHHGYCY